MAPQLSPERITALEALRAAIPGVQVDFDPSLQAPRSISAPGRFLTSAQSGVVDQAKAVSDFVQAHAALFGIDAKAIAAAQVARKDVTAHNGMATLVWQQQLDGVPVFQSILKANVTKRGEIITLSSLFLSDPAKASAMDAAQRQTMIAQPAQTQAKALALADASVGGQLDAAQVQAQAAQGFTKLTAPGISDATARMTWFPLTADQLKLGWQIEATSLAAHGMFRWVIDAADGRVLYRESLTSAGERRDEGQGKRDKGGNGKVSSASDVAAVFTLTLNPTPNTSTYFAYTTGSPTPMSPALELPLRTQPATVLRKPTTLAALDATASPIGWITAGTNETVGNNADAHTDSDSDNLPDLPRPTSSTRNFNFPIDLTKAPATYADASVVNAFYWVNWCHDQLYGYGFTEEAGNFQTINHPTPPSAGPVIIGGGVIGNLGPPTDHDAVIVDVQDDAESNNASMATPSDGSPPRLQLGIMDAASPGRDSALDAGVIIHEYVHGLTHRLVGGGAALGAVQSNSMGEGWSDWYALALLSKASDPLDANYLAGDYCWFSADGKTSYANYYFGIRRYPYTTRLTKNPLTFKDVDPAQASAHSGIPRNALLNDSSAAEVHAAGEVWCIALWEVRAALLAKHGYTTGHPLALHLITDALKLTPPRSNFIEARDAVLLADQVNNSGANLNEIWAAFAKRGLGAAAYAPPSSQTTGYIESFTLPDTLSVSPIQPFAAKSTEGTAPSTSSFTYQLTNLASSNAINWSVTTTTPWLTLSPASGVLVANGTTSITVTFNREAVLLTAGMHEATLVFSNNLTGQSQSRSVQLTVSPLLASGSIEDFESAPLGPQWALSGEDDSSEGIIADPSGGTQHVLALGSTSAFSSVSNEAALTVDLAGRSGQWLVFDAKLYGSPSNTAPTIPYTDYAEFDGVAISADGGTTWYEIQSLRALKANVWQHFEINLDAALATHGLSYTSEFKISFHRYGSDAPPVAGLVFDDIAIAIRAPLSLGLAPPASVVEGQSGIDIGITQPTPNTLFYVPTTHFVFGITIGTGQLAATSLTFSPSSRMALGPQVPGPITAVATDNALFDGPQNVRIIAARPGYLAAVATTLVLDNEAAYLSINAPASVTENGSSTAIVAFDHAPDADITIGLNSSDSSVLSVPASVVIHAGETQAQVLVTALNDNRITGDRTVTITASVPGMGIPSAEVEVLDNESTDLTLAVLENIAEPDGAHSQAGRVSIAGTLDYDLEVELTSSQPSRVAVPDLVVIPAGQTSVSFAIEPMDNATQNGPLSISLLATALDFNNGSTTFFIADDEDLPSANHPQPPDHASDVDPRTALAWSIATSPGSEVGNLVFNGSFEQPSLAGWTTQPAGAAAFRLNDGSYNLRQASSPGASPALVAPAAGSQALLIAAPAHASYTIYQDLFIPIDGPLPMLSWQQQLSIEPAAPNDPPATNAAGYRAELRDPQTNAVLETLAQQASDDITAFPQLSSWQRQSASLTAYRGRAVRLVFSIVTEAQPIALSLDAIAVTTGPAVGDYEVQLSTAPEFLEATSYNATVTSVALPAALAPGTYYWRVITYRGEDSRTSPTWTFTVNPPGPVASFEWSPLAATQPIETPLNVTLTAKDKYGRTATSFNGRADLAAQLPALSQSTLVISEVEASNSDHNFVELTNTSAQPINLAGYQVTVYDRTSWPGALTTLALPGVTLAPGATLQINEFSRGNAASVIFDPNNIAFGLAIAWQPSDASRTAVLLRDAQGHVLDFFCAGSLTLPSKISLPQAIPSTAWIGGPVPSLFDSDTHSYQRIGHANSHCAIDWQPAEPTPSNVAQTARPSATGLNTGLTVPFTSPPTPRLDPIATDDFTNGIWTGIITLHDIAAALTMIASEQPRVAIARLAVPPFGESNSFAVVATQSLTLSLPPYIFEDGSFASSSIPTTGRVTRNGSTASSLTVQILSSEPSRAPGTTVTIPAGQASVSFPVASLITDDSLANGTSDLLVEARAPGFNPGSAPFTLYDKEPYTLTVTAPAFVTEGEGPLVAAVTVTASQAVSRDIPLIIGGSDNSITLRSTLPVSPNDIPKRPAYTFPPTYIVIRAGDTTATADLTVLDNNLRDGNRSVQIITHLQGWTDVPATVRIIDPDVISFTIEAPADLVEGIPGQAIARLHGITDRPIDISFTSPSLRLIVPKKITVPAGSDRVSFPISVKANGKPDTDLSFPLIAIGSGFQVSQDIAFTDADVGNLNIYPAIGRTIAGQPTEITIAAYNGQDDFLEGYNARVNLRAIDANNKPILVSPTQVTLVNGEYNGPITFLQESSDGRVRLVVTDPNTKRSNTQFIGFIVGHETDVHHFDIAKIPGPQKTNVPFTASLTAKDRFGNTITDFSGTADLSELTATSWSNAPRETGYDYYLGGSTPNGAPTSLDLMPSAGDSERRFQLLLNPSSFREGTRSISAARLIQPTGSAAKAHILLRLQATSLTNFDAQPVFLADGWTTVFDQTISLSEAGELLLPFTRPFIHEGKGNVILDLLITNIESPAAWVVATAAPLFTGDKAHRTLSHSGSDLIDYAAEVNEAAMPTRGPLVNLETSDLIALPSTTDFTDGIWTGPVAFPLAGTAQLVAITDEDIAHRSNPIVVTDSAPLADTVSISLGSNGIAEGSSDTVYVSLSQPAAKPIVFTFTNDSPDDLDLPATLTFAKGQSTGQITLTAARDTLLEGIEKHSIPVTLSDGRRSVLSFSITEPAPTGATFTLPASIREGDISTTGTITLTEPAANDLYLYINSSQSSLFTNPTTILAGQASATFPLRLRDDQAYNGPRTAILNAVLVTSLGTGNTTTTIATGSIALIDNAELSVITSSDTFSEADTTAKASLSIPLPPYVSGPFATFPLQITVSITSSDVSIANPSPTAILSPASSGAPATATVPLNLVNNTSLDGPRTVDITFSLPGIPPVVKHLTITDDEFPVNRFTITGPQSITEGSTAQVTISLPPGVMAFDNAGLPISLIVSDGSLANVPSVVTIPVMQNSVSFDITILDNAQPDAFQQLTVSTDVVGYPVATYTFNRIDNDQLRLIPSGELVEGSDFQPSVGLMFGQVADHDIVISLSSASPGIVSVPASVTLPAGQNTVSFSAHSQNDDLKNGQRSALITATAPGMSTATQVFTIFDDEVDQLRFRLPNGDGRTYIANQPILVEVALLDLDGNPIAQGGRSVVLWDNDTGTPIIPNGSALASMPTDSGGVARFQVSFPNAIPHLVLHASIHDNPNWPNTQGWSPALSIIAHGNFSRYSISVLTAPLRDGHRANFALTARDFWGNTVTDHAITPSVYAYLSRDAIHWGEPQATAPVQGISTFTGYIHTPFAIRSDAGFDLAALDPGQPTSPLIPVRQIIVFPEYNAPFTTTFNGTTTLLEGDKRSLTLTLRNPGPATTYRLQSTLGDRLILPATITVPNGKSKITIPLQARSDTLLNGDQTGDITLTDDAAGYQTLHTLTLLDNDGAALALSLPSTLADNAPSFTATLTASASSTHSRTIQLTSSNPALLSFGTVPSIATATLNLTLPAGATSITFDLLPRGDGHTLGTQPVTLTATALGWQTAKAIVNITGADYLSPGILTTLTIPDGTQGSKAIGSVELNRRAQEPVTVRLISASTLYLKVPTNVVIPKGKTRATFTVTYPRVPLSFGSTANVEVTANARDYLGITALATVADDEFMSGVGSNGSSLKFFDFSGLSNFTTFNHLPSLGSLPAITTEQPSGTYTAKDSFILSGKVTLSPASTGALTINGQPVTLEPTTGRWQHTLSHLPDGDSTFILVASDQASLAVTTTQTWTLHRIAQPTVARESHGLPRLLDVALGGATAQSVADTMGSRLAIAKNQGGTVVANPPATANSKTLKRLPSIVASSLSASLPASAMGTRQTVASTSPPFLYTYHRLIQHAGLRYIVETSHDLVQWQAVGSEAQEQAVQANADSVTEQVTLSIPSDGRIMFTRLRVEID